MLELLKIKASEQPFDSHQSLHWILYTLMNANKEHALLLKWVGMPICRVGGLLSNMRFPS